MNRKPTIEQMQYLIEFLSESPRERAENIRALRGKISARVAEKFARPEHRTEAQAAIEELMEQGADLDAITRLLGVLAEDRPAANTSRRAAPKAGRARATA